MIIELSQVAWVHSRVASPNGQMQSQGGMWVSLAQPQHHSQQNRFGGFSRLAILYQVVQLEVNARTRLALTGD